MKAKRKKPLKFGLGDLVKLNDTWDNRIGIVLATGKSWWVARGSFDISNCIASPMDVVKVLKRKAVPKRYLKYMVVDVEWEKRRQRKS